MESVSFTDSWPIEYKNHLVRSNGRCDAAVEGTRIVGRLHDETPINAHRNVNPTSTKRSKCVL